ncbi:helix-turn-helix transcriptional regulator [Streptomyces sp. CHD11]|uniref:helix-turn-helix domain-containing protein n=1 Tax=Streptomyces sp. CHD11 TaxID=2741325 RepID=UPI001BFC7868|nr:helix-turn-helix transcriptional regulator [Streptomyces sp. CHD11]MBT3152736.1 helix-turn-helix transcriptional regulator [Streptomyces sp. CHD11]
MRQDEGQEELPIEDEPGTPTEVERLDINELGRLLRERRGSLSLRQAAAEACVSFSTLSRVEAGAQPDLASFTALCAWLRLPPSRFFTPVAAREVSPLDQAITHLRADPRLSDEAAERISAVLRDLYAALAKDSAPAKPAVACHLRASPFLRPGVPARLASLLSDMNDELHRLVEAGEL